MLIDIFIVLVWWYVPWVHDTETELGQPTINLTKFDCEEIEPEVTVKHKDMAQKALKGNFLTSRLLRLLTTY